MEVLPQFCENVYVMTSMNIICIAASTQSKGFVVDAKCEQNLILVCGISMWARASPATLVTRTAAGVAL